MATLLPGRREYFTSTNTHFNTQTYTSFIHQSPSIFKTYPRYTFSLLIHAYFSTMDKKSHIVILPSPGMGHLIPLTEFAKRLIASSDFSITFVVPTNGSISEASKIYLDSLPNGINYTLLPPISLEDLSNDTKIESRISIMIERSNPSLRVELESIMATKKVVALVVDLFGTDAFDVAIEFNVSPYIFFPSTAMALSLFLYLPKLDQMVSCEYRDLSDPIQIPGCIPIHGRDLLDPVQNRKDDAYKWILHHAKRYRMAEGIIVNSFKELEGGAINSLQEEEPGKPHVYPVGPLVQMNFSVDVNGSDCLKWLDGQPIGSVLFISFGSGGILYQDQINELAYGLEMSEQRFLWVVRSPKDKFANAQSQKDPFDYLPKGFMDRTKGHGLVVSSWAPQAQVLSHGSTGGFLTHCGFNSILESVVNGVPLIAWPLCAEQKMNAVMLTEDLKVALRPKFNENGIVDRLEIASIAKSLLEGEEGKQLCNRMRDLKDAAQNVLSTDGSSTKTLSELACKWKNKINY